MEFLRQLEQSGFSSWVRESPSLLAYPTVLFLHTIGMGLLVGVNAGIDLRILGFASGIPVAPLEKYFRFLWIGFWINAVSGSVLLAADATTKLTNPVFYVKMVFISLAIADVYLIKKHVFRNPLVDKMPLSSNAKIIAATSLFFWLAATTAGRLMAYIGPVSGLSN